MRTRHTVSIRACANRHKSDASPVLRVMTRVHGSAVATRTALLTVACTALFAVVIAGQPAPAAADSAPPACVNASRYDTFLFPAAAFGAVPNPATTRAPVVFDGSCSTGENPDGTNVSRPADTWNWTFGDGATATGSQPTHTY